VGTFVRLALTLLVFAAAWHLLGPIGLAVAAPIAAFLLSSLVLSAVSFSVRAIRKAAYQPVEGSYYEFRSTPVEVREDEDGHRWLNISDVRRVVVQLPRDATLLVIDPRRVRSSGYPATLEIRADGLTKLLDRAQDPKSVRFRLWVQREILFPSAAARAARGTPNFCKADDEAV
jgi:hypothetical protein